MAKNEEQIRKNIESLLVSESLLNVPRTSHQKLVPSMGPLTVVMLEAGCSSQDYYQALIEQCQAVKGGKYPY